MPEAPDVDGKGGDPAERLAASSEVHAAAWRRTLDEMRELDDDLRAEGWETVVTAAGRTAPVAPADGKGYWGLVHVVPDSDAGAIGDAVDAGEFPTYDVYRSEVEGRVFGVTVLLDPGTSTAVLVGNQFELRAAAALIEHAREEGAVNSVFRYLDGTVVAKVRHDDPAKFFPRYETFGGD